MFELTSKVKGRENRGTGRWVREPQACRGLWEPDRTCFTEPKRFGAGKGQALRTGGTLQPYCEVAEQVMALPHLRTRGLCPSALV